ncbi:MAG: hypothetical protein WA190_15230, partial [Usitatibacter sp.]
GMPNARNLNFVLGSVGKSLKNLSKHWKNSIPPLQCVVVNKATGLPGKGVGWFIGQSKFAKLSKKNQRQLLKDALYNVYAYRRWNEVLRILRLKPTQSNLEPLVDNAANFHGGGESAAHKKLKNYIAKHPTRIGLPSFPIEVTTEYCLPSADRVDVLFEYKTELVAVEVKPEDAPTQDLVRGVFQCIKYQAVLESDQSIRRQPLLVRTLLVVGGKLGRDLLELKNALRIDTIEGIRTRR